MGESLPRGVVQGEKKNEVQEMMETYIVKREKAMESGKREDLPRILQTKLNEHKRKKGK